MDRMEIEAHADRVRYLRGLLLIPLGLCFLIQLGLLNLPAAMGHGPGGGGAGAILVVLVVLELVIRRYYRSRFGRASWIGPSGRSAVSHVGLPVLLVLGLLVDQRVHGEIAAAPGWMHHLSATTFGVSLGMLLWLRGGRRPDHAAVWGALLLMSVLPVWGWGHGDPTRLVTAQSFALIGAGLLVGGALDHRQLCASLPPLPREPEAEAALA